MTQLTGLRARRDAALAARLHDEPLPGLEGVVARFRPITVAETNAVTARYEKAKDRHAANIAINAILLGQAFVALRTDDGAVLSEGITDELIAEFCPDIEDASLADVIKGLFTDDAPLFAAGGKLAKWSLGDAAQIDEDLRGN